jgi:hypothetical protein
MLPLKDKKNSKYKNRKKKIVKRNIHTKKGMKDTNKK